MAHPPLRLGVNVDHVATLRNARAGRNPDPVRAALAAIEAGADGITAHLREDRRHIRDEDMARLKAEISKPLIPWQIEVDLFCHRVFRGRFFGGKSGLEKRRFDTAFSHSGVFRAIPRLL